MHGFLKFIIRGNMIGLAVGVVIGSLFSSLVQAFVETFITPVISIIAGHKGAFSGMFWNIHGTVIPYGDFLNDIVTFVLIAAAMYFLVVMPVNKVAEAMNPYHDLAKAKRACPACLSQIPAKATRCSYCCKDVDPITDEESDQLIEEAPGMIDLGGAGETKVTLKPGDVSLGGAAVAASGASAE
ncbi:MscL family protein [Actinospica durhamensis]|uniref:MscL family protein n=1 Tax=Actinospica durhamensis TaxID=1508375 RepID=A0A941EQI3_9ACTN|nr:MscL family protein [Actinospica durhamensis]MBR7836102.1 MscL family protein [Actinospica durhamensis]